MTEQVRKLRVELSKINISSEKSNNSTIDMFAEHARVNLLLGRNWLGEALKYTGELYPYEKDENRKNITDVKPAVDVAEEKITIDVTNVEDISIVRQMLEKDAILAIDQSSGKVSVDRAIDISKMHFSNVRMLLGNILGVLRDVNQAKSAIEQIKKDFKGKAISKEAQSDIEYFEKKLLILGERPVEDEF